MAEGSGEKKHAPTERKLREAAAQGQIKRSADLPKAAVIVFAASIGLGAAAATGQRLEDLLAIFLSQAGTARPASAMSWTSAITTTIAPLLALIAGMAIGSSLFSGGWILTLAQMKPDLTKLDPLHGLGEIISAASVTEVLKSALKFIIIGGTGAAMIHAKAAAFAALSATARPSFPLLISICLPILAAIATTIIAVAAADVGLQFWLHRRKLRMTDEEVRSEMKDSVGNPHVKQRQRATARRMARSRQMRRIPEASVVVTNPAHYAVAIRYRRGEDSAPVLLAKGVGLLAAEIVSRARGYGIPVVEAPPLARAVYAHAEPGDHIPVPLYRACAEVLAYVWKIQNWRRMGGAKPNPPRPQNLDLDPANRMNGLPG
jgi:flagellar biosynthetic protein FlhB